MTADYLQSDQIAVSLMHSGATEDQAIEAVERAAIERDGLPRNEMAEAMIATRVIARIKERLRLDGSDV